MVPQTLVLILCLSFAAHSTAEVFTAMADMEHLLAHEKSVKSVIDQYIDMEMKRLEKLKSFATEYQKRNLAALHEGATYIGNPVNAFLLIKRLTSDWAYVETLMKNNLADEFLANITGHRGQHAVKFPDQDDLKGAATALLRLQDTYRLDTTDIASGHIKGVKRADELSAHDCFEMGRTAYNLGDYYHTLMWMQEGLNRLEHEGDDPSVAETELLEYLAFSLYQQGNIKRALVMTKRLHKLLPDHPRAAGNVKWYEDMLEEESHNKPSNTNAVLPPLVNIRPSDGGNLPERDTYEALCRGEILQSPKTLSKLYCYFKRDRPYLILAPIKVEILRFRPLAVMFKNVVSDDEVNAIKHLASPRFMHAMYMSSPTLKIFVLVGTSHRSEFADGRPRDGQLQNKQELKRATVHNKATGQLEHASYRISKSAWLKHYDHPVVARINNRMDMMTNLNMDTAEELQIANYGLGGHYDPHFDFARIANYGLGGHYEPHFDMSTKEEKNAFKSLGTGNRIATVLFYMQAPEAGGATVFTDLKTAVFPIQGDALFWYNLHRDGEGDLLTRHAACPVLSGVKWVANKWIHERGQEVRRPCAVGRSVNEQYVGDLD